MLQKWWAGFPGPSHNPGFGFVWFSCSPFPFCQHWCCSGLVVKYFCEPVWPETSEGLLFLWVCFLLVSFWTGLLQVPTEPWCEGRRSEPGCGDSEVLREAGWPPLGGSQPPVVGKMGCVCIHKPWLMSCCLAEVPASESLAGAGKGCLPVWRLPLQRRHSGAGLVGWLMGWVCWMLCWQCWWGLEGF